MLLSSCAYQGKRGCLSEATLLSQRRGGRQQACPFAPQTGKRSDAPSACLWEEVTIHPIPFSGAESMKYRMYPNLMCTPIFKSAEKDVH